MSDDYYPAPDEIRDAYLNEQTSHPDQVYYDDSSSLEAPLAMEQTPQ